MTQPTLREIVLGLGPADASTLIALRALLVRANGGGAVERASWLTGLNEEYRRWYGVAGGLQSFPEPETERYLDDHIVRQLVEDGVLERVRLDGDGEPERREGAWSSVRLAPAAATEVEGDRAALLELLDGRIRGMLAGAGQGVVEPLTIRVERARPEPVPAVETVEVETEPAAIFQRADAQPEMGEPVSADPSADGYEPAAGEPGPGVAMVEAHSPDGEAFRPYGDDSSADAALAVAEPEEPAEAPGRRRPMLVPGGSTLRARGLVKVYRKRRVVNEVDLEVSQGEIVGLLGPNGAGKTTSFYMMVGLIAPDRGKVFLDSRELTRVPMYRRARAGIGYLAQEPSIFRKLTVEENVMAILQMMKLPRREQRKRLEEMLDELSIKHLRKTRAYALSGGERRRLEITRALVGNPKFMLLDEPFAGVDPIAVHDIQQIVSDLRRRGIGVLISDHNVEQTLDIVDRAYIMYDGRVRVSGTVGELVWNDEVAEIYLGPTLTARMRERYPNPAQDEAV